MNITPLGDVVIIEKDKTDESSGGIALLDSHKDPAGTDTGVVVAYKHSYRNPQGVWFQTQVEVGQRVLFLRKHGIAIKGSKTAVAVRYENLLAIIEDE